MRGRIRHLNPASAGATVALDARFLSGFADGDAVGTWTGRGGSSPTASGSNRPTYKTNILNGQPVVRFDGVNDVMTDGGVSGSASDYSVLVVRKSNTFPIGSFWFTTRDTVDLTLGNNSSGAYFSGSWQGTGVNATSFRVESWVFGSSTGTIYVSGANSGLGGSYSPVAITHYALGGDSIFSTYYYDGDIAAIAVIPSAVSAAVRKRIEHSLAFSFRVACA